MVLGHSCCRPRRIPIYKERERRREEGGERERERERTKISIDVLFIGCVRYCIVREHVYPFYNAGYREHIL
jgi:hypothetical protein